MAELLRTYTKKLPCRLTEEEIRRVGKELAGTVQEIQAEEESQTKIKADLRSRLAKLEERQSALALAINTRTEERDVDVNVLVEPSGVVHEVRADTGEHVQTRLMTDEESQIRLPLESEAVRVESSVVVPIDSAARKFSGGASA